MRKAKMFLLTISLVFIIFIVVNFKVISAAQVIQEPMVLISADLPELPDPGLKPGDFFYFLDEWGEAIEEFFTFKPEYRARLQTERALERVAEIKALVKRDGVTSPHLTKVKKRIQENIDKATTILEEQKTRGVVVAELAKELGNKFDTRYTLLEGVFEATMKDLEIQEKNLREQIRDVRQTGNFEKVRELQGDLINIRAQKEKLSIQKNFTGEIFETEIERIETKMEIKEREIRALAREARALLNQRKIDKRRVFEQKEKALELQEEVLGIQLEEAFRVENLVLIEETRTKLQNLEAQEKDLEVKREIKERVLVQKKEGLGRVMAMRERAKEQIKEAREELLDVKEGVAKFAEVPTAVFGLVKEAESKLVLSEQTFADGNYSKAFGQAMAAEMLTRNTGKMLEEKIENFIECIGEGEQGNIFKNEMCCKGLTRVSTSIPYSGDCIPPLPGGNFICAKCGDGICGLGENWCNCSQDCERVEKEVDKIRETEKKIKKMEDFFGVRKLDERKISCIKKCSAEIREAKDCVFDIISKNIELEEILRDIRIKTRLKRDCLDEAMLVRTCLKREECYQLFVDKLREKKPEIYEDYKRLAPLLPVLPVPDERIRQPDDGHRIGMPCRTDRDCAGMICPTVIGGDTPQCGPGGICICGPGRGGVPIR